MFKKSRWGFTFAFLFGALASSLCPASAGGNLQNFWIITSGNVQVKGAPPQDVAGVEIVSDTFALKGTDWDVTAQNNTFTGASGQIHKDEGATTGTFTGSIATANNQSLQVIPFLNAKTDVQNISLFEFETTIAANAVGAPGFSTEVSQLASRLKVATDAAKEAQRPAGLKKKVAKDLKDAKKAVNKVAKLFNALGKSPTPRDLLNLKIAVLSAGNKARAGIVLLLKADGLRS